MGPPPQQSMSPGMLAVQEQAKADRIASIQDSASAETRNTLIRFGRLKAFSGASMPGLDLKNFGQNL